MQMSLLRADKPSMTWQALELVAFAGFLLTLLDFAFEAAVIRILRARHREFWMQIGAPSVSLAGYIRTQFNARRFVESGAERQWNDAVLDRYCSAYRTFNRAYLSLMGVGSITTLVSIGSMLLRG